MVDRDELPLRPRLAPGVWGRRHRVDGEATVVLEGAGFDGVLHVGEAAWRALAFADGTRDLEGVRLACAHDGVDWTESELEELLGELNAIGFLVNGAGPHREALAATEPSRAAQVEPLAGYRFACDGDGTCCRFYDTVVLQPHEAERTRLRLLEDSGGDFVPIHTLFTPFMGAQLEGENLTMALQHGRCALLSPDGRCPLHACAPPGSEGADHKPLGCRVYPAMYIDDGVSVRVSFQPECACVFSSLHTSNVDSSDREPVEVPGVLTVPRLASSLCISDGHVATPDQMRRWAEWLDGALRRLDADPVSHLWWLAEALDQHGLVQPELPNVCSLPEGDAVAWLGWLGSVAEGVAEDDAAWRARDDAHRITTSWLAEALTDPAEAVAAPRTVPEVERWYLLNLNHGYRLACSGRCLADGLRDRATRIVAARAMMCTASAASIVDHDSAMRFPITLVEAAMRKGALARYAPASGARWTT